MTPPPNTPTPGTSLAPPPPAAERGAVGAARDMARLTLLLHRIADRVDRKRQNGDSLPDSNTTEEGNTYA